MGNAINDSITVEIEPEDTIKNNQNSSLGDGIKAIGDAIFKQYPEKTSNLSQENINGMIRINTLNEYMERNFGVRYKTLDILLTEKQVRVVSHKGFGLTEFREAIKSIQASYEQTQIPDRLNLMLRR